MALFYYLPAKEGKEKKKEFPSWELSQEHQLNVRLENGSAAIVKRANSSSFQCWRSMINSHCSLSAESLLSLLGVKWIIPLIFHFVIIWGCVFNPFLTSVEECWAGLSAENWVALKSLFPFHCCRLRNVRKVEGSDQRPQAVSAIYNPI